MVAWNLLPIIVPVVVPFQNKLSRKELQIYEVYSIPFGVVMEGISEIPVYVVGRNWNVPLKSLTYLIHIFD
jgi:hypothetical protein